MVNATPGNVSLDVLGKLAPELAGKVLVDIANATGQGPNGMPTGLLYPNSSLGELLQRALPATKVVKTLNTMLFTVMSDPKSLAQTPTAFLSGDDGEAKATVRSLLQNLGWENSWIEDLGGIESARGTEAFMLLVPYVIEASGFQPVAMTLAR